MPSTGPATRRRLARAAEPRSRRRRTRARSATRPRSFPNQAYILALLAEQVAQAPLGLRLGLRALPWRVVAHFSWPAFVTTSRRFAGIPCEWRDPDSNRGHHDFQGLAAERFSPQNTCRSVVSMRRHRDAVPLVSVGFPWVWDSMESLRCQTSRVRRARRTSGSPRPCRRARSVAGRPCDRRPCCGTGSTAPRSGSTSGRRGTAWSRAQAGRAR